MGESGREWVRVVACGIRVGKSGGEWERVGEG